METVLTALVIIAIIVFAVLTLTEAFLSAQDTVRASWQELERRWGEQARTDLSPVGTQIKSDGAVVELTLRNDGDTKLADFDQWDVIVQYYEVEIEDDDPPVYQYHYHIYWLPYVESEPVTNEWKVVGIYLDAAGAVPETYEPGILNPGEEILLRLRVSPPVGPDTANLVALSTSNGVGATTIFARSP
jgi:archaellum component FlaF (FlaF/FlaG flagellin family)